MQPDPPIGGWIPDGASVLPQGAVPSLPSLAITGPLRGVQAAGPALRDAALIDSSLAGIGVLAELEAVAQAIVHLKAVFSQTQDDLISATLSSIENGPQDWSVAFLASLLHEVWGMITGPFHLLVAIAGWSGDAIGCLALRGMLGWAEITSNDMLTSAAFLDLGELCKGYEQYQEQLARMQDAIRDIASSAGAFFEHPLDWTTQMLDALALGLEMLTATLAQDGALHKAVVDYMSNPSKSGALLGAVVANVAVSALQGGEVADLAELTHDISLSALQTETAATLASAAPTLSEATLPEGLIGIVSRLRIALRAQNLTLAGRMTDRKYQIFLKLEVYSKLGETAVLFARERIAIAVHTLWGLAGSYDELGSVSRRFNAHSQVMYLLELQRQGVTSISDLEATVNTVTLAEQTFERAHLLDERFLDYLSADARALLGWNKGGDMPAILATASEHQRSWPRYFKSFAQSDPLPPDLNELKSITETFKRKLIKVDASGKPLPHQLPADADAIFIGPSTHKASEIVQLHINLWSRYHHTLAERGGLQKLATILDDLITKGL